MKPRATLDMFLRNAGKPECGISRVKLFGKSFWKVTTVFGSRVRKNINDALAEQLALVNGNSYRGAIQPDANAEIYENEVSLAKEFFREEAWAWRDFAKADDHA